MTKRIIITGIVQGVGFRPFIYNLARSLGLKGTVANTSEGVVIFVNVEDKNQLNRFIDEIKTKKPPSSRIDSIMVEDQPDRVFKSFEIITSSWSDKKIAKIPADLAICRECIDDISDPANRRFLYPFTNCTNCGPRFTITKKIPYDRKNTSMNLFKMCRDCNEEYNDPQDRRFHAQPNACSICGPTVWVEEKVRRIEGVEAIDLIAKRIAKGDVVLIKGLGGFHMACDAFNRESVFKIREIKKREFKPLAIMVEDLKDIEEFVLISEKERSILTSPIAPIVMLKKKHKKIFEYVAPGLGYVGVMIAYTPLHKVLFMRLKRLGFKNPLVMTSGNLKDHPIIKDNDEAKMVFKGVPILYHNREIINRVDDSVGFVDRNNEFRLIRRARGYVPNPIRISKPSKKEIFAAGGDLKNTFAFLRGDEVFVSQYIGDLDNPETASYYRDAFYSMKRLYGFEPQVLITDMHPLYRSSQIVQEFRIKKCFQVQHHLAHIYSVMAEYRIEDKVIGVSFDGTGYGFDGRIWGGEFFVVKEGRVFRAAKLDDFFIVGGDSSIKEIWKSFLSVFFGKEEFIKDVIGRDIEKKKIDVLLKAIDRKVNGVYSSSCGRLFDAVSVVVTGKMRADFEAEGPMRMEAMVVDGRDGSYRFTIDKDGERYVLRYGDFLDDIIKDYPNRFTIAKKFHNAVVDIIVEVVSLLSKEYSIKKVVLSGGVFQNRYILDKVFTYLQDMSFEVYSNKEVPVNDGGIALGQIYFVISGDRFIG